MNYKNLNKDDLKLIEEARAIIKRHYFPDKHHIGAAIKTTSGKVYTAVHLDGSVGQCSICAESIALGKAISEGDPVPVIVAAVRHPRPQEADQTIKVVSPCGRCREIISDFGPDCYLIVPTEDGVKKVSVAELLPFKYKTRKFAKQDV
ncbi:MAG: cytidine deaminase [Proteobacteria bacterium]|nr:cytidine deaminase [Pseudomonadota bacterium]